MHDLALLARASWRHLIGSIVVLAVIGGVGVGFAATAVAGARRADTAYERLGRATRAPDAFVDATDLDDNAYEQLASDASVRAIARFSYTPVAPAPLVPGVGAGSFVGLDDDFLDRVYRPLVIDGRLARRNAGDEVVVNEALARAGHYRVGQRVELTAGFENPSPIGRATIVGVVRGIFDVGANASSPQMLLGHRFLTAHADDIEIGPQPGVVVRFAHGEADVAAFQRRATRLIGHEVVAFRLSQEATSTNRALSVQTIGLGILGAIALVATAVAILQAVGRLLATSLADLPVLVAMGFPPRRRAALGALIVVPVALLQTVIALIVGVAGSPLIPTGFARSVDPTRGVHVDALVAVLLPVTWGLALVGAGAVLAWRERRRPLRRPRPGRLRELVGALPVRARLGWQAALAPVRTPTGAATRSALVAMAAAVAGVVGVATFGTSLGHLLDSPRLQGWSFDAAISSQSALQDLRSAAAGLEDDPAVERVAWASVVEMRVGGRVVEGYAFDPDAGTLHPTIRAGRAPLADDEIALGADTLDLAHVGIGDRVRVEGPGGAVRLRVVGSATYPELGNNSDLAGAVSLTSAAATRIGAIERASLAMIQLRRGHGVSALTKYSDAGELVKPFEPPRVRNLEQIGAIPWILAGFLAILGVAAVGHALLRSVRGRRHEHAVLAAFGFRRRDLQQIVLWQATTMAFIALVIGVVGGFVIGRAAWSAAATATGVVERVVLPGLVVAGTIGATLVLANLAATTVRLGSRHRPADELRAL